MERPSWVCTVFTQLFLCLALYFAFNLGHPRNLGTDPGVVRNSRIRGDTNEAINFHFFTVRGGFRTPQLQDRLMGRLARTFKPEFVLDISEHGEDDPLMQNDTRKFTGLEVPWYSPSKASGRDNCYFNEKIKMPHGRYIDIVGVGFHSSMDTESLESSNVLRDEQYKWISRTLEATQVDWRIFFGFHPLTSHKAERDKAEENTDPIHLHDLFMKFGVNLYLSGIGCTSSDCQGGIAYVENPSLSAASSYGRSSILSGEAVLLLHRVTQLKIVTYFINIDGEVVHKAILRQQGKEKM